MPRRPCRTGPVWIRSRRKRLSDLFLLLCLLPPTLCVALFSVSATVARYGRRGIFAQKRVGLDGRLFTIHKLRTMTKEGSLTKQGNILAILGADEVPQLLYTIWTGRMALIGPRPLVPHDFTKMAHALSAQEYQEWYCAYTACRPGWMGAFSRNSRLYPAQSNAYLRARYRYDTFYLKNACLKLDLIILLKSLTMWCTPPQNLWLAIFPPKTPPSNPELPLLAARPHLSEQKDSR